MYYTDETLQDNQDALACGRRYEASHAAYEAWARENFNHASPDRFGNNGVDERGISRQQQYFDTLASCILHYIEEASPRVYSVLEKSAGLRNLNKNALRNKLVAWLERQDVNGLPKLAPPRDHANEAERVLYRGTMYDVALALQNALASEDQKNVYDSVHLVSRRRRSENVSEPGIRPPAVRNVGGTPFIRQS